MTSKLRKSVHSRQNLDAAWRVIQRNGKYSQSDDVRHAIEKFSENPSSYLGKMQHKLSRGKFDFGLARGAPIKKLDAKGAPTGKIRPIVIASLEARIVQRALLNVLIEIPELKPFVNTPFSFGGLRKQKPTDLSEEPVHSAVPAAIKAVLDQIADGHCWVATADITAFFTRISKSVVTDTIRSCVKDDGVMKLLDEAISVELENLADLRSMADQFPIEDIGVAQGNSLSPLLGNILLADFDAQMNEGDCSCIRYIDDFIILAPSRKAANARLKKAVHLLGQFGMELSSDKTSDQATPVADGFEFLGIEISPGLVRPAAKARAKLIGKVRAALDTSKEAILGLRHGKVLDQKLAAVSTLKRVDGIIDGWGKHYWFCNDRQVFASLDDRVRKLIASYLGFYSAERASLPPEKQHIPLGMSSLSEQRRSPFAYPKKLAN